jgi:mRNA-degrading endonuclease RelE of RelBE toxin-antitoxin system
MLTAKKKKSEVISFRVIHHPLKAMPNALRGLCRIRVGDYRIIYWIYSEEKHIKIYEIEYRSKDYRSVRK